MKSFDKNFNPDNVFTALSRERTIPQLYKTIVGSSKEENDQTMMELAKALTVKADAAKKSRYFFTFSPEEGEGRGPWVQTD